MTKNIYCIIPARMASSRFPGKPLAPLLGLPLILHVLERCRLFKGFVRTIVATCDVEIKDAVETYGGEAIMTNDTHERCTDRICEAIDNLKLEPADDDLIVMVQGDEVLMSPDMSEKIFNAFKGAETPVINLASRLYRTEDHDDPNTVKVVGDPSGKALYFSRAPIPSRARMGEVPMYQQTGVMGFTASFLRQFDNLPQTPLEILESVDMMRVLEHGMPIQLVYTDTETIGVDTPQDLKRAEKTLANDDLTRQYLQLP
jgi:3-deoxy-manno-octulosonate cytidylyltransferase (CMP-KDO synthetase)